MGTHLPSHQPCVDEYKLLPLAAFDAVRKAKILERTSHQVEFHSFPLYLLIVVYGILLYLLCALLFPDGLKEYEGFEGYFYLRKQWFFGLLAAAWAIDYVDTLIKGGVRASWAANSPQLKGREERKKMLVNDPDLDGQAFTCLVKSPAGPLSLGLFDLPA